MSGKDRNRQVLILLVLLAVGEASVVAWCGGAADVRSLAQFILFPFILILLSWMSLFGHRIPPFVLGSACLCALVGALLAQGGIVVSEGAFLMARLEGDSLGSETKVVRDRIRSVVEGEQVGDIVALEREVSSVEEARQLLDQNSSLDGVVWGSRRFFGVTLRQSPAVSIAALGQTRPAASRIRHAKLKEFLVITSVPSLGISFVDKPESIEFLGRLVSVWGAYRSTVFTPDDSLSLERQLLLLSSIPVVWTSVEPRSFALWMLGTYQLVQGMMAPQIEPGLFSCSKEALYAAYSRIPRGSVAKLEVASINNFVLAALMAADRSDSFFAAVSKARKDLRKAHYLVALRGIEGDYKRVVEHNLKLVEKLFSKGRKKYGREQ